MSEPSKIVLYDIPSRSGNCWSWNTWKSRFMLNYKGLDYMTEWTEYPAIKPTLEPHLPGEEEYTCPTIRLGDGSTYIMDSAKIATHLETTHPSPPLLILPRDSPLMDKLIQNLRVAMIAVRPLYVYLVYSRLLNDASKPFFYASRSEDFGQPLEQVYEQADAKAAWEDGRKGWTGLAEMLRETEGPFFGAEGVSYADFVFAGVLLCFKQLGDDIWKATVEVSGDGGKAYEALLKAVEPWSKRSSY